MSNNTPIGSIGWTDLTVLDAENVRDFYAQVVGWKSEGVSMGDYEDFVMNQPESGNASAGICHARGTNADMPAMWMIYLVVEDLDKSLADVEKLGGQKLSKVKPQGNARYCIIRDPAGAVCALYQP